MASTLDGSERRRGAAREGGGGPRPASRGASRLPGEPDEGVEDFLFHPIEPRDLRVYASWKF
ncbi:MAG TPA: hypothetical protein VE907_20590 [Gammaproteobacteria bacterium]|nr:hypothetical protein [Gammaproteobacteria bacterium]